MTDLGKIAREAADEALRGACVDGLSLDEIDDVDAMMSCESPVRLHALIGAAVNNAAATACAAIEAAMLDEIDRLKAENDDLRARLLEYGVRGDWR